MANVALKVRLFVWDCFWVGFTSDSSIERCVKTLVRMRQPNDHYSIHIKLLDYWRIYDSDIQDTVGNVTSTSVAEAVSSSCTAIRLFSAPHRVAAHFICRHFSKCYYHFEYHIILTINHQIDDTLFSDIHSCKDQELNYAAYPITVFYSKGRWVVLAIS